MFKSKGIYFLAGLLLLLNLVLLSFFWYNQGRKPHPPHPPGHHKAQVGEQMKNALNLTEEQYKALESSRNILQEQLRTSRNNIKETRENIHKAITQNPPDSELAQRLSSQLGAYYEQEENLLSAHYLEIYHLCDESQKQQLPEVFLNTLGPKNRKGKKGRGPESPPHH